MGYLASYITIVLYTNDNRERRWRTLKAGLWLEIHARVDCKVPPQSTGDKSIEARMMIHTFIVVNQRQLNDKINTN